MFKLTAVYKFEKEVQHYKADKCQLFVLFYCTVLHICSSRLYYISKIYKIQGPMGVRVWLVQHTTETTVIGVRSHDVPHSWPNVVQ